MKVVSLNLLQEWYCSVIENMVYINSVELKDQIDLHICNNGRISIGEISSEIVHHLLYEEMQKWHKAQLKTFYFDGIRKLMDC